MRNVKLSKTSPKTYGVLNVTKKAEASVSYLEDSFGGLEEIIENITESMN